MNLCFLFFLATVPITDARIPSYAHEDSELEKVSSELELEKCDQTGRRKVFQIEKQLLTWNEHNDLAKGKGCALASMHSEEDMKAVLEVTSKDQRYWIGGNLLKTNRKTWTWSDESQWDFTAWYPNQPDNAAGDEDCLEDYRPESIEKQWNDEPCKKKKMAIYYCPRPCFKLETQKLSWNDHNTRAISQGDVLASIHNQADWLDVLDIVKANPTIEYYYIGGKRKSLGKAQFVWSDGSLWDFTAWAPDQPISKSNSENCVEVFSSKKLWFDFYCNDEIPAIYMSKVSDETKTW